MNRELKQETFADLKSLAPVWIYYACVYVHEWLNCWLKTKEKPFRHSFSVFRDVNIRLTVSNSISGLDRLTQLAPAVCRTRRWQDLRDLRTIYSISSIRIIIKWTHILFKRASSSCNLKGRYFRQHELLFSFYWKNIKLKCYDYMFLCIGLITRWYLAQSTLKMNSKLNLICD